MKLLFNRTIFFIIFIIFYTNSAFSNTIELANNIDENMLDPNYWLTKDSTNLILNSKQVEKYNQELVKKLPNILVSFINYKITKENLQKFINIQNIKQKDLYKGNLKLYRKYYENLAKNINITAIKDNITLTYGVIVAQSSLKTYPTTDIISNAEGELGQWTKASVLIGTPVIILHTSKNHQFSYVQMEGASGWILSNNIATTPTKEDWEEYLNEYNNNFLLITANHFRLNYNPYYKDLSKLELTMGTKLTLLEQKAPLLVNQQSIKNNYVVKIPVRKSNGILAYRLAIISYNSDVNEGYLPFNEENIIKQAFKMQGEYYDWTGVNGQSPNSFINNIFSVFGIMLPKTFSEQSLIPHKISIQSTLSYNDRQEIIFKLKPGTILMTEGHVALYLGFFDSKSYVIHAIGNEYINKNANKINQVMITTTDLELKSNTTLLNSVTNILYIGNTND